MKARVKATDEIIDVEHIVHTLSDGREVERYETEDAIYVMDDLDFDVKEKSLPNGEPDYWEKLKHQAAIVAMQGILSNNELFNTITEGIWPPKRSAYIAERCDDYATALVNRLKEEEK